mgnify:CR=1 FL=1
MEEKDKDITKLNRLVGLSVLFCLIWFPLILINPFVKMNLMPLIVFFVILDFIVELMSIYVIRKTNKGREHLRNSYWCIFYFILMFLVFILL